MDKVVLLREIPLPFPLIGVPLPNHFNTHVATLTNLKCVIKARLSLKRHCNKQYDENTVILDMDSFKKFILSRLNMVLNSVSRVCVEGNMEIRCYDEVPLVALLSALECELLKKVLPIDDTSYTYVFNVLSDLDMEILKTDPGYLRALRCSYLFKKLCIARGYEDVIHNFVPAIKTESIYRYACDGRIGTRIDNPYDDYTLSLLYKLTSHIISKLIQNINNKITESTIKNLVRLIYVIESEIVRSYLGIGIEYPIGDETHLYKVVLDLNGVQLYRVSL